MAYALTFLDVDAADSATDERRTKLNVKCACFHLLCQTYFMVMHIGALAGMVVQVRDVSSGKDEGLIGGATVPLYNILRQLETGKRKVRLWLSKVADGSFSTN
ncbi:hypothetical protein F8388_013471 [Cannabis sativa]|uniref:C2 PI3K-type domain-containing protein n=1 Tax=Cannabis sativa TaxID=3483 RepID=A0A7J6EXE2_CANSA|nr:hypothetical protein F8388_013471 [Cannabis sativa]KAF4381874.1 hypothetical protein G4B88_001169 [Cannabis sativa]